MKTRIMTGLCTTTIQKTILIEAYLLHYLPDLLTSGCFDGEWMLLLSKLHDGLNCVLQSQQRCVHLFTDELISG